MKNYLVHTYTQPFVRMKQPKKKKHMPQQREKKDEKEK